MTQSASDLIIDRETAQVLLHLLNPLHGSLDRQFLSKQEHPLGSHPDDEHDVIITARQERDLTQAVCILHNRLQQTEAERDEFHRLHKEMLSASLRD